MIDHATLCAQLAYAPETGVFTRKGKPTGTIGNGGYLRVKIGGKKYQAHILAWFYVHGVWPKGQVDHKDRNRQHNAIDNLRDVSVSVNMTNRGLFKNNQSGTTGVRFDKRRDKWQARVPYEGRFLHLGYFPTQQAAVDARAEHMESHGDHLGEDRSGQHLGPGYPSHYDGAAVSALHSCGVYDAPCFQS
jgi:hypothetical protein